MPYLLEKKHTCYQHLALNNLTYSSKFLLIMILIRSCCSSCQLSICRMHPHLPTNQTFNRYFPLSGDPSQEHHQRCKALALDMLHRIQFGSANLAHSIRRFEPPSRENSSETRRGIAFPHLHSALRRPSIHQTRKSITFDIRPGDICIKLFNRYVGPFCFKCPTS